MGYSDGITEDRTTCYTGDELFEALRALASLLAKCEKFQDKLMPGTSQRTLLDRRMQALRIALDLIAKEAARATPSE